MYCIFLETDMPSLVESGRPDMIFPICTGRVKITGQPYLNVSKPKIYSTYKISGYNCHSMYWHRYLYPYLNVLVNSDQGFLERVEGG